MSADQRGNVVKDSSSRSIAIDSPVDNANQLSNRIQSNRIEGNETSRLFPVSALFNRIEFNSAERMK